MEVFRFKSASQFAERYQRCELSAHRISFQFFNSVSYKKFLAYFNVHFDNQLIDFGVTVFYHLEYRIAVIISTNWQSE
jgi:hypothetical protein